MASIAADTSSGLILTKSPPLRLVTLLVFYFTQGFPIGLFVYAIPAWMAANGANTVQVAAVVGTASLPWSLKLMNGFLIDRYTFLPMGRRRVWIIGAQSLLVLSLLIGALLSPAPVDVAMLSAIAFCANVAVTFQDVGIDSLAIDIMPEDERAKAGGIMGGAQLLGMSATMAGGGYLLDWSGITLCLVLGAVIPAAVMLFGVALREREGERRLPWSAGQSHPHNLNLQVAAWWPLLKSGTKAIAVPLSLCLLPVLLVRSLPSGAFESFHPVMVQERAGWSATDYSNFSSLQSLASGLFAMLIGGPLVARVGAQRSLFIALVGGAAFLLAMALLPERWSETGFLLAMWVPLDLFAMVYFVCGITLAMRLCDPRVAATQFTIYMALGNFGRPLGASLAAATAGAGHPQLMYGSIAALWLAVAVLVALVRYPAENRAQHVVAHELPQGEALPPKID
jgi:PAT family beta-lactamase induction signal transducer AmpG